MRNKLFHFSSRFSLKTLIRPTISHFPRLFAHSLIPKSNDDNDDQDLPFTPISTKTQNPENDPTQEPTSSSSDLPFDFMYSYSETNPALKPLSFRESPKFSPFGPGRIDRAWTGIAAPARVKPDPDDVAFERDLTLGDPLTELEVSDLVERYRHNTCSRQINLGKDGVTHNTLIDVHNHWRRAEAVRILCIGVPTLDMDNLCFHLEDKTGGKIIYRHKNILILYRGRNYDPKKRPEIPVMLWRPYRPIYPKLVKQEINGLTVKERALLRNRGRYSPPLMILTRNGFYGSVVERVRKAFETDELVRLDCKHVGTNDCKQIGVKLKDLVPCVLILIKDEQIVLWRGKINSNDNQAKTAES